ncbi:putative cytochrome p450 [Aspergillus affinis]|uniref:putative cytochrome p450 n=1 Tax=Aspergillus affinis TaxID=1070780 RepID=UPI0022FF321C|nr:putative cytochrome p450 [Aspergillus affinis]KAI9043979.1 putative cytochrome p450 [Aspergillus affinis]
MAPFLTAALAPSNGLLFPIVALCLSLLLWRFWRFVIRPKLRPLDPKELPYWIPIVGHAAAFFNNSYVLLRNGDKYFRGSKESYAVEVMGQTIYVVTSARDSAEIYKNTATMSFEIFVRKFIRSCGASDELLDRLYGTPPSVAGDVENRSLGDKTHDFHGMQLFPGGHLPEFTAIFKDFLEDAVRMDRLPGKRYITASGEGWVNLRLMKFVSDYFVDAGQRTYFGNLLGEIDPDLIWTFLELEDRSWQILYEIPAVFARKAHAARDGIIDAIQKWFETPPEDRPDGSWWMTTMEAEMKALGFNTREMATTVVPIYIGSNTSTRKACFWLLSFLLFNPQLIDIIREETKPALGNGPVDLEYLKNSCPQLNAIWMETLRMATSAASFRFLTEDTMVGNKLLRKGNRVLVPSRQLHYDPDAFGDDVQAFNPERFLTGNKLTMGRNWKPFGGGKNQYPGRFVAQQQTFLFVTLLLHRFDIEMLPGQSFPRPKKTDIIRSRTGCQGCRERKTKCDEQKPTCGTCTRLGKVCRRDREFKFQVTTGRAEAAVPSSTSQTSEMTGSDGSAFADLDLIRSLQHTERDIFYSTYWECQCLPALHPIFHSMSRLIAENGMLKDAVLALSSCNLSRLHAEQRTQSTTSMGLFSPSLVHQTRSQLYYSSAIRRFASLNQLEYQANATLSLTVLVLFAYIESSMGNFHGFSCHVQGLSDLFIDIHDAVLRTTLAPFLSAWMQVRFVVWWARAYFSSIEVHQQLPSIALPPALNTPYTSLHERRVTILSIMCEAHRITFQTALKHWSSDTTSIDPNPGEAVNTEVLLAEQSHRLDEWLSHLPPSEQPIPLDSNTPSHTPQTNQPIIFPSHDAALNFAYSLIARIMTSPSFLTTLPSANPTHLGQECSASKPFLVILLRVLAGISLRTSLVQNTYTIGFSSLLLASLLRCQDPTLGLEIQTWLQKLHDVHPTEEGAFPVYQALRVARAVNRQRSEHGFDVFAVSLPVDDGGGWPKFSAYNSQRIEVLLFHGKWREGGMLGVMRVGV